MDLQNEQCASVEEIEMNFGMVTVFAEDDGGGRKRSPNFHRRSSPEVRSKTSASDLRGFEWRLEKAIVLMESARRGLRRHIYIGLGFGKVSEFLNFGILNKSFSVPK